MGMRQEVAVYQPHLDSYDSSCKNSDYLSIGVNEWLQAPYASNSNDAALLSNTGSVSTNDHVPAPMRSAQSYISHPKHKLLVEMVHLQNHLSFSL